MPRNGSGGYTPPSNSFNPALNGVAATATDWNATLSDLATAIQQSISADGQTPITGNLQMGGNKLTGLGAGSGTGQSLRFEQLFSQGALTDIASAATTDIGAQLTNLLRVTGTTGITSFGTNYNGPRFLIFQGIVTLTHSATLVLPGAANITTAANDALIALPISGGWQVVAYQRGAGMNATAGPLAASGITGAAASGANVDITSLGNNTSTIYTTGGTSTAYTITPLPAITAYAIGQSFVVNFNAASGTSPTLQISGIATPPNLVKENPDGTYSNIAANDIPINHRSRVTLISATQALIERFSANVIASGAAPVFAARAWCQFNGTTTGTFAPTAGGNVSSITRNSTGDYTVTFTTAMVDANYAVGLSYIADTSLKNNADIRTIETYIVAAGSVRILTGARSSAGIPSAVDFPSISVEIYR